MAGIANAAIRRAWPRSQLGNNNRDKDFPS
jgi:hypothetical protein